MNYKIRIIFGKEQVIKAYNNLPLSAEELDKTVKEYTFNTLEEKEAFIKGINEAIGWTDCCIPELELCEG